MGGRSPGLINLLFNEGRPLNTLGSDSSESNDSNNVSAGAVLLLVGVLGLTYYAISEAEKDGCSGTEIGVSLVIPYSNLDWCRDNEPP
jgi:hypothetical protein